MKKGPSVFDFREPPQTIFRGDDQHIEKTRHPRLHEEEKPGTRDGKNRSIQTSGIIIHRHGFLKIVRTRFKARK